MTEETKAVDQTEGDDAPVDIGMHLYGPGGQQTIKNAIAALGFVDEMMGEREPESMSDQLVYGRWLVIGTINRAFERGLQQLDAEHKEHREEHELCETLRKTMEASPHA